MVYGNCASKHEIISCYIIITILKSVLQISTYNLPTSLLMYFQTRKCFLSCIINRYNICTSKHKMILCYITFIHNLFLKSVLQIFTTNLHVSLLMCFFTPTNIFFLPSYIIGVCTSKHEMILCYNQFINILIIFFSNQYYNFSLLTYTLLFSRLILRSYLYI